ncbi:homeotic protein proboscipedia-like [Mercenaria mercenaria]|uniref:homeotic protein proboscipedia-like n=1 Tax=Mercenaria mercenaria TaxID=6596 RepID=UPI00234ED00B|nr:homeotic protein proboscipedia-like [Mercenaria mercenaria]
MIEVDSVRRNYNIGPYDPGFAASQYPLGGTIGTPHYDNHRVLVHWNQPPAIPHGTSPTTTAAKSDGEDDDDDDEDRPFTPPPPRERLSYTRYQLELLNGIYEEVRYPNSTQKQLIAKRVGITREQVKIWFQNRRRKDVIGNTGKPKSEKACDTSTSSTCSTGSSNNSDSQQNSPVALDGNESSSSEENSASSSVKDDGEQVVPNVVMKSVIGELIKFTNDPLKGKKNRKKKTNKQKEKAAIKKGLATTLLTGSYDMINPPNQVTPTAFFEKIKSGFNHSKNRSAFASPRDFTKPTQISRISSSSDGTAVSSATSHGNIPAPLKNSQNAFPFPGPGGNFLSAGFSGGYHHTSGCEIPVLSELLTNKPGIKSQRKDALLPSNSSATTITTDVPSPLQRGSTDTRLPTHTGMAPFTPGRPLNGIYPYPFLAEQPRLLSSLRQQEHIFRPSAQYPVSHFSDDPYQPLFISSLGNPYFSPPPPPPPVSWQGSSAARSIPTSAYTQL